MTKKAEREAQILQNRRDAFAKKVRSLTGHVAHRMLMSDLTAAFDAGKTADAFAAEVASREPVGMALHTQKVDAVNNAETQARGTIAKVEAELSAGGWDIRAVAPYPKYNEARYEADRKKSRYHLFHSVTERVDGSYAPNAPQIVRMSPERIDRFVDFARQEAALQYDAFICKMVLKTGDQVAFAAIEGSHVWDHSILTVTLKDGTVQRWKTQQIWNVSVLGKSFPQWPSRIVK